MTSGQNLTLTQENGQQHDSHDDTKDQQQAETLVASCLLVSCRLSVLNVGLSGVIADIFDIVHNRVERLALLADNVRHLSEQHVQVAHALLNAANLLLALHNQRLLEVDVVLVRDLDEFLTLQLLQRGAVVAGSLAAVLHRAGRRDGRTFPVEGLAL